MPTEELPSQFNFKDVAEPGGPSGSFMDPFDPRSPGFSERMKDPTFVADLKTFRSGSFGAGTHTSGPTSFSPGGGVPSGGPDTGIAKIIALSKPGALSPTLIPPGVSGVRTSFMRGPGGGGHFGGPFGSLGGL